MLGAIFAKRAVRQTFDALNRRDIDEFLAAYRDDAIYEYPTNTILGGTHKGKPAIRQWWETLFERMPETRFTIRHLTVENISTFGRSNYVHVGWEFDETDTDGNHYHLTGVTAIDIVGGKARSVKCYVFDQDVVNAIWPARTPAEVA